MRTIARPSAASSPSSRNSSAFVPTSIPRAGSSKNRTLASVSSHLATTTFCWLPPDSVSTRRCSEGARMSSWSARCSAASCSFARSIQAGLPGMRASVMFVSIASCSARP
jgi:hypothetical protein